MTATTVPARASTAARLDPRMRARRVAVLRAQGRRRLRILLTVIALAALAAGAWWISRTPLLDVDRITVTGVQPSRNAELLAHTGLETGIPMVDLDSSAAENALTDLAWVKSATVRRDWPATVHIEVVPRVPVAVAPASDGRRSVLIDANAYVIDWASPESRYSWIGLPRVAAPFDGRLGAIHTDADEALAVVEAVPDDLWPWVRAVTVLEPAGVGLDLFGGAEVIVGPPVLLDDKMSAVRAVLAGAELECIIKIDVTMPDISTVARHPDCA